MIHPSAIRPGAAEKRLLNEVAICFVSFGHFLRDYVPQRVIQSHPPASYQLGPSGQARFLARQNGVGILGQADFWNSQEAIALVELVTVSYRPWTPLLML